MAAVAAVAEEDFALTAVNNILLVPSSATAVVTNCRISKSTLIVFLNGGTYPFSFLSKHIFMLGSIDIFD
jgi:hypothetical protein